MITGDAFARQAESDQYTGIPYSKLDCQGFVERVLSDAGVRDSSGNPYNWKGSNSMWRNALSWKGTIEECRKRFGRIPLGAWVFIIKNDGGEKLRGYNDNEGNASHVGIFCSDDALCVRDSTKTNRRDGVGYRVLDGFSHVGLCKYLDYNSGSTTTAEQAIHTIRNAGSTDADYLAALQYLINYLGGN